MSLITESHQGAKLVLVLIRHKARLEQTESRQIRDPGRIVHVRLAAGNRLDVRGVGDGSSRIGRSLNIFQTGIQ